MSDIIKFDYGKARMFLKTINDSKQCLEKINYTFKNELDNIGEWWKGDSYTAFRQVYEGSGGLKSILDGLTDETLDNGNYLAMIANTKKDYEKISSKIWGVSISADISPRWHTTQTFIPRSFWRS